MDLTLLSLSIKVFAFEFEFLFQICVFKPNKCNKQRTTHTTNVRVYPGWGTNH